MKRAKVLLCMVLSLLMLVDYTVFQPAPAFGKIDKKSALIGGAVGVAAGAGIALAAPAIGGAIAGAGGIGGIGAAIVGGIAAIGGGVIGAVSAFAGAIGAAISAVGGFIAGIFTSPLFIPALLIVGACVAGYFIYKKYKEKKANSANSSVLPESETITITPGDYEMSSVFPEGEVQPIGNVSSEIIPVGSGESVKIASDETPVAASPVTVPTTPSAAEVVDDSGDAEANGENKTLEDAHNRYLAAYQKYTSLVTNSGGADSNEVNRALKEYQDAYREYNTLKAVSSK
jgi:hypothetical protein